MHMQSAELAAPKMSPCLCSPLLLVVRQVPQQAGRVVGVNITQPLIQATGQLRWALNNIVEPLSPPCTPLAQNIYDDPTWITSRLATPGYVGYADPHTQVSAVPPFLVPLPDACSMLRLAVVAGTARLLAMQLLLWSARLLHLLSCRSSEAGLQQRCALCSAASLQQLLQPSGACYRACC